MCQFSKFMRELWPLIDVGILFPFNIIIIIISLFQEVYIFGTNASLTYGPRLQR